MEYLGEASTFHAIPNNSYKGHDQWNQPYNNWFSLLVSLDEQADQLTSSGLLVRKLICSFLSKHIPPWSTSQIFCLAISPLEVWCRKHNYFWILKIISNCPYTFINFFLIMFHLHRTITSKTLSRWYLKHSGNKETRMTCTIEASPLIKWKAWLLQKSVR